MSTRIDGEMTTYPLVPYMDRLLKQMAEEEQIAYWSIYDAMGGQNSMVRWVEVGLAGSDYVHFTRSGAKKVGRMLYDWLMGYAETQKTKE
jgi:lysophospholipase L1-like esterase